MELEISFETAPRDLVESVGSYLAEVMGDELVTSKTNLDNLDDAMAVLLRRGHSSASVAMLAEKAVTNARMVRA